MTSEKQEKLDEQLRPLYAELQKFGQTQDWDRALKVTRKILGISSNEKKATHCKIVCLMQLDKFDEALNTIVKNATDTADLFFERAYCEYRLNRIEDAHNSLTSIDRELDDREQELLAQVLFKLEKYNECVGYYRTLLKNNEDEYQSTRQANFIAALATWSLVDRSSNIKLEANDLSDETYDTTYNSACVLLSSGQYLEAEIKLRKADAQCRRELEEEGDMTEDEILRETANIRVQLAYCLQEQGKSVEALTLYNDVLKSKPTDLAIIAVASNNLAVLNRDQNLFDSRKRIKTATAPETEPKLNSFQKKIVQVNEALLAIYTGQHETARRILDKMVQKSNDTDDTIPLAKVSLLIKEKKLPEATQLLQEFIENNKQRRTSLYCRLTYVQLLLSQGKVSQACDYLRNDDELLVKPGIVATLVTLYNYLEDSKSAAQVLNEAVDRLYNLDRTKGKNSRALAYLIKQNIVYQEKQGNGKRVTEMLEILHKLYPNDTNTLSKLIVHYLKSDPERANLLAQKLPSIKQLAEGIDADTLESAFGKRVPKAEKTNEKTKIGESGLTSATTVTSSAAKQKKKRKRKIRLPKKYDPSSKPDPERWLPLRERTYYRGKRGKRGKQAAVGKGTQGAVGSDQSSTTTITTASGAQRSMPSSKGSSGSTSTQPKPMPPPNKSAAAKRKGKLKFVPIADNKHGCCLLPSFRRQVYPTKLDESFELNDDDLKKLRQKVESFVFTKLQEYSKKKSIYLLRLTSLAHIRRRLKRDIKSSSIEFNKYNVPEEKVNEWIDEIIEQIQSYISQIRSIFENQDSLEKSIAVDHLFSSKNNNTSWRQLQLKQVKNILGFNKNSTDDELLSKYKKYVLEKLTPKQPEGNKLKLGHQQKIDLDEEYKKAEEFARDYLSKMFETFKQRQRPNLKLIQNMIDLGMEQMMKRPKSDEFREASLSSNILTKATFVLKSKRSYLMSLQNLADDFMLLRFGHSLDSENNSAKSISDRFISHIHMFLNTISLLLFLLKSDSSESFSPTSLFSPFNSDLPNGHILSPNTCIDEWTWLIEKWKLALETFPISLTNQGAFGRLVRTTVGVGISRLFSLIINDEKDDIDKKVFQALQMGYYYGIAYALVDGLQDSQNNQQDETNFDHWFEKAESILCGNELDSSLLPKLPITPLLLETFNCLAHLTSVNSITQQTFTDLALLLRAQRLDKKNLENPTYDNVDLYLGPFLKSHFTYTATAFMGGAKLIENLQRLWITPFLGQLTDDCRDINEDTQSKSITPVTYYIQHNGVTFNPFFAFLFVCEDLYLEGNQRKNTGAFLGRRIMRTLRSLGDDFKSFLSTFTETSDPELYRYLLSLENLFHRIGDPEKAIFRHVNTFARNYAVNHRKLETFAYDCLPFIEKDLLIKVNYENPLIHGMNYSLKAGGKRLRPLLLLMVAQLYKIDNKRLLPLARAIEYLHTSSLIFDDLPAQDNAPLRRGQPTLHRTIDSDRDDIPPTLTEGRAQLSAVNLIAYAIKSVTNELVQENFSYESVNHVTAEIAESMSELCSGQFLDLQCSRINKSLTVDELDRTAYLKTGKAIEITLVCPVILAGQDEYLERLREVSRLMGILFQMKDDLLDVDGNTEELGKLKNIDEQNKTVTYISLLGVEDTRQRIVKMRKQVETILNDLWPQAGTVRNLIQYICERTK